MQRKIWMHNEKTGLITSHLSYFFFSSPKSSNVCWSACLWANQQITKKVKEKTKNHTDGFTLFDFRKAHLVGDCLVASVCGKLSQMKSLSAVSPYSRPTLESLWIVGTQSRYEFVTFCHFILGCRQSSLTKQHSAWKLCSARFFFSVRLPYSKKLKEWSQCYQKIIHTGRRPSYLTMLKAIFLPKSAPFG